LESNLGILLPAANTVEAVGWCQTSNLCVIPADPETIARYLSEQAGRLKCFALEHIVSDWKDAQDRRLP
jgi:hypothetical protein